ncbi:MAG: chemotaxis protein CheB [Acidobacteriota bacterium]|jgi:two-component system chemotaxis response regulator CheB
MSPSGPRPIRIAVAARSPLLRARSSGLIAGWDDLRLTGVFRSAEDLLRGLDGEPADLLLLGTEMLAGPANPLLQAIRQRWRRPVILLASSAADPRILAGLEGGAAAFLLLPPLDGSGEALEAALGVIREVAARDGSPPATRGRMQPAPGTPGREAVPSAGALVVIGASTGGPRAVQTVLEALPGELNASLLIGVHMPLTFTALYAERLSRICRLRVREAGDGDPLPPGVAGVLPGGCQAEVFRRGGMPRVRLRPRREGEFHAPSLDLLMSSAAAALGSAVVGILLTGMGQDGARGMGEIRRAGGWTVAESRETALIFGMPGEAIRSGSAAAILPLHEIPAALVERCGVLPANAHD